MTPPTPAPQAELAPSTTAPAVTPPVPVLSQASAPSPTPETTETLAALPQPEPPQAPDRRLSSLQQQQAAAAWAYFEANYEPETGLVRDREDVDAATPWGMGSYLMALQAA